MASLSEFGKQIQKSFIDGFTEKVMEANKMGSFGNYEDYCKAYQEREAKLTSASSLKKLSEEEFNNLSIEDQTDYLKLQRALGGNIKASYEDVNTIKGKTKDDVQKAAEDAKMKAIQQTTATEEIMQQFVNEQNEMDKLFFTHPIYKTLKHQIGKGLKKYNTPVQPEHYSLLGWNKHLQEELIDAVTYNAIAIRKIEEVEMALRNALRCENKNTKIAHIKHALDVITEYKKGNF